VVEKLIQQLEDPIIDNRVQAIKALAARGPEARAAAMPILKMLEDPGQLDLVHDAAEQALNDIGPPSRAHVAKLASTLQESPSLPARRYAAIALGRLGRDARDGLPALLGALKAGDVPLRVAAAAAVGPVAAPGTPAAQRQLFVLLRDDNPEMRTAALQSLRKLSTRDSDLQEMKTALADTTAPFEQRVYAAQVLLDHGKDSAPSMAGVLTADLDPRLASLLIQGLSGQKARQPEVGEGLARALDHKDATIRHDAARALAELGLHDTTLTAFLKGLSSPDSDVVAAVVKSLPAASVFNKDLPALDLKKVPLDLIKPLLANTEPQGRLFAAYALGSLGPEASSAAPQLRAAFLAEKNRDPKLSPRIRLEILIALSDIGPEALTALSDNVDAFVTELLDAANDTNEETRFQQTAAALALASLAASRKESKDAYPVLIRALLPPPGPVPINPPRATVEIEKDLNLRSKNALVKAGRPAADALVDALYTTLNGRAQDKVQARVLACHLIGRIGPAAKGSTKVTGILNQVIFGRKDDRQVVQAAREALASVQK
jgi:hypothetical protein